MQPHKSLFIPSDRQQIYLHFPNRHKFRHQPKLPWLPICEWRPKFQLLSLGRAIHNGATFSMFSNEFSRWKSAGGGKYCCTVIIMLHELQLAGSNLYSPEDFFHHIRKTGFVHLEKLGLFPLEKLASISSRWGSMLERLPAAAFLLRFLHFPKFLAQKVLVRAPFLQQPWPSLPFFSLGIPFFYVFKCAAKSKQGLLRGRWKTLWRRQKVGACSQKQPQRLDCMLTATSRK